MINTTTVSLTDEEALQFVQFQKHYSLIQLLNTLGIFDIKSGYVTIHFDGMGRIGSVDKWQHYRPNDVV